MSELGLLQQGESSSNIRPAESVRYESPDSVDNTSSQNHAPNNDRNHNPEFDNGISSDFARGLIYGLALSAFAWALIVIAVN